MEKAYVEGLMVDLVQALFIRMSKQYLAWDISPSKGKIFSKKEPGTIRFADIPQNMQGDGILLWSLQTLPLIKLMHSFCKAKQRLHR